jgi:hypothetical protein
MATNPLSLNEISQASFNANLSARASKVIAGRLGGRDLTAHERMILNEAASLLGRIREGEVFVENGTKMSGRARPHQVLGEYHCAVSALRRLNQASRDYPEITQSLSDLTKRVAEVAKGEEVDSTGLQNVKMFFNLLSEMFFTDVRRPTTRRLGRIAHQY